MQKKISTLPKRVLTGSYFAVIQEVNVRFYYGIEKENYLITQFLVHNISIYCIQLVYNYWIFCLE